MRQLLMVAAALFAIAGGAAARPLTIEDILRLEAIGPAVAAPNGRWLILEVEAPYLNAVRFDNDTDTRPMLAHLERIDLLHPASAAPAFPQAPRGGYIAGPFSPSGDRMVVYRCLGARWELGVVDVERRSVRWLGVGAELADWGDTVVWRSERELLVLALPRHGLPQRQRLNRALMTLQPALWRRARRGTGPTAVALGSGRFVATHPADLSLTLERIDIETGVRRALARGAFESLTLSPSGRWLALIETGDRIQPPAEALVAIGTPWRRRRLRLYNLTGSTGAAWSDFRGDLGFASLTWAPGRDSLLAFARRDTEAWTDGRFYRIEPGRAINALDMGALSPALTAVPGVGLEQSHAGWFGSAPLIYARSKGSKGRADWYQLRETGPINLTASLSSPSGKVIPLGVDAVAIEAGGALWRVTRSDLPRVIGDVGDSLLEPVRLDLTAPSPAYEAEGGDSLCMVHRDDDGLTLSPITLVPGALPWRLPRNATLPSVCTPTALVSVERDAHGTQTVSAIDRNSRRHPLLAVNRFLSKIDFAAPMEVDHTGPDGQPLKSWFYRPTAGSKTKPPPLIVEAYPGWDNPAPPSLGEPGALSIDDNPQLAAARGYAVLVPSLVSAAASTNPGQGWNTQIWRIVDQLAGQGLIDPRRVGYWGHSFGGYVGLMLATQTDRFAAIVTAAAPSDLISWRGQTPGPAWVSPEWPMFYEGLAGWFETGSQGHLEATPWSDLQRYIANSPALAANKIRTPILLVQGDQDPVSLAQGQEMFSDLYRLHKDAELVTFFGENHTITSPQNMRRYFACVMAFFDRGLGLGKVAMTAQSLSPVARPSFNCGGP